MSLADPVEADRVAGFDVAVARFTVNRRGASRVSQAGLFMGLAFSGLDSADGQILSDWLKQAEACGINAAVDLSVRPWHVAGAPVIVGIFEKNRSKASWLVVRCTAGWMLVGCSDGSISEVSAMLTDILALIGDEPPG
jgi:hypothetical protein